MDNMCVSSYRCCVLISVMHPVAILSVVFCVIRKLSMRHQTFLFHSSAQYCLYH